MGFGVGWGFRACESDMSTSARMNFKLAAQRGAWDKVWGLGSWVGHRWVRAAGRVKE